MKKEAAGILLSLAMIFLFSSCTNDHFNGEDGMQADRINFDGNAQNRDHAIKLLDEILKDQGDFGVYGDLSDGLTEILRSNRIDIREKKRFLEVSIYPISGQGHDFTFTIDVNDKKLIDLVVGELAPEPEIGKLAPQPKIR